jgi:hypothetical protein
MIISYLKDEVILYDFDTIRKILKTPKSSLHRRIKENKFKGTKYKNQILYPETILFTMMENVLIEKLTAKNGLSKDKGLNG